jgi:hypothetical protein
MNKSLKSKKTVVGGSDHRLVSGLSDYERFRLLYHLLQRREWDGQNGRPWDAYLCGQAEREIQMLISR